jgi:hypothetical protein
VQQEEDEAIKRRRWWLRLDALWYRVLGRSALSPYKALPEEERRQAPDLPGVLERLEIGDHVDRRIAAAAEVEALLE